MIPKYPKGKITTAASGLAQVDGKWIVDITTYVTGLLNQFWDQDNVATGRTTIIDKFENWHGQDYLDVDYILVYAEPGFSKQLGISYSHESRNLPFSLQFLGKVDSNDDAMRISKLVREAQRIILSRKPFFQTADGATIGGGSYVRWNTSESPTERIAKGHRKFTISCEARRRWYQI